MSAVLRDAAKGLGWALVALVATGALYVLGAFRGWEGVLLGAVAAAGAADGFHKSPRVSILSVVWFALGVAGAFVWFVWALSDMKFRAPGL